MTKRKKIEAVKRPPKPKGLKYSGDASVAFWERINKARGDDLGLYRLGCDLQNLERYVLEELEAAERLAKRKARR